MQEAQKLERTSGNREGSRLIDSISRRITVRSAIRRFFSPHSSQSVRGLFVSCMAVHVYGAHEPTTYGSIIF